MKIKKTILLTERQVEMLNDMQRVTGLHTISDTIYHAISFCHSKTDLLGIIGKPKQSPLERAKQSVEVKQAKNQHKVNLKFNEKSKVCVNVLGGEVFKDKSGLYSCRYHNYDATTDEEQIIPLDILSESYGNHQFFPDRESVLEARPELKEKFEK